MKFKMLLLLSLSVIPTITYGQNITNTLAPNGSFKITDGSTDYLSLSQSNGFLSLDRGLVLPNTTSSSLGVLYMGASYFLHNYGTESTFLGVNSGNFNMTGIGFNTAVGGFSLNVNTTGYYNSAFGNYSLRSNTTGNRNSAVGYTSLYSNTSGTNNTAVGNKSLFSNTTGYCNTAVGDEALSSITDGNNNTAFGYQSLKNITNSIQNAAFGVHALYNNQSAWNDAFGNFTLFSNTTGHSNSAFGHGSLYYNTTGDENSVFGNNAGQDITTGNNNICIGNGAEVPSGTTNSQVRIGNNFIGYAGIQVAWTITSDRRWKENIKPVPLGLNFISELNPVSYSRKNDENHRTEYGLIAQEVEEVMNEYGIENTGMLTITEEGMYELRYNDLIAPMIKAIQELEIKNEQLSKGLHSEKIEKDEEIAKLKEDNLILKSEMESLSSIKEELSKIESLKEELIQQINELKSIRKEYENKFSSLEIKRENK